MEGQGSSSKPSTPSLCFFSSARGEKIEVSAKALAAARSVLEIAETPPLEPPKKTFPSSLSSSGPRVLPNNTRSSITRNFVVPFKKPDTETPKRLDRSPLKKKLKLNEADGVGKKESNMFEGFTQEILESTRLCLEDESKMGFDETEILPTRISLVDWSSKSVPLVHVYLARVYPIKFLIKGPDGKTSFLSEEAFNIMEMNREKEREMLKEKILNEFEKKTAKDLMETPKRSRHLTTELLDDMTGDELLNLLQHDDSLEFELSKSALKQIEAAKLQRNYEVRATLEKEMMREMETIQPQNQTPVSVLKILIVDAEEKSGWENNFAFLYVWRPSEEELGCLIEKLYFKIRNLVPGKGYERRLNRGKTTAFEPLSSLGRKEELKRFFTPFSQIYQDDFKPLFGEFDFIGLIVLVPNEEKGKEKDIYLTDADRNLLILKFFTPIEPHILEKLQVETFICVQNVQWRYSSRKGPVPIGFFYDYSSLTTTPARFFMKQDFRAFKQSIPDTNLVVNEAKLKIANLLKD